MPLEIKKIPFPVDSCLPIDKPVIHNAYIENRVDYGILPLDPIMRLVNFNNTLGALTISVDDDYKFFSYDPNGPSFTHQADIVIPVKRPCIITDEANQKIYFLGGELKTGESTVSAVLYVYDHVTKTTATASTLPLTFSYAIGCVIDGKLLAYGYSYTESKTIFMEYNLTTGVTDITKPITPGSLTGKNLLVFEGNVYGITSSSTALWRWNMTSSSWSSVTPISYSSPPDTATLVNLTPLAGQGLTTIHVFESIDGPNEHDYSKPLTLKVYGSGENTFGIALGEKRTSPPISIIPTNVSDSASILGFNSVCEVNGIKYFAGNLYKNDGHLLPNNYVFGYLDFVNNQIVISYYPITKFHFGMITDPLRTSFSFIPDGELPPYVKVNHYYGTGETDFMASDFSFPSSIQPDGTWLVEGILPETFKHMPYTYLVGFECSFIIRDGPNITNQSMWSDYYKRWDGLTSNNLP